MYIDKLRIENNDQTTNQEPILYMIQYYHKIFYITTCPFKCLLNKYIADTVNGRDIHEDDLYIYGGEITMLKC